jgi:hypothetical protein
VYKKDLKFAQSNELLEKDQQDFRRPRAFLEDGSRRDEGSTELRRPLYMQQWGSPSLKSPSCKGKSQEKGSA